MRSIILKRLRRLEAGVRSDAATGARLVEILEALDFLTEPYADALGYVSVDELRQAMTGDLVDLTRRHREAAARPSASPVGFVDCLTHGGDVAAMAGHLSTADLQL